MFGCLGEWLWIRFKNDMIWYMYSDFSGVGVWLNGCGLILARYGHCSVSVWVFGGIVVD